MSSIGNALFGSKSKASQAQDMTPGAFRDLRSPLADTLAGMLQPGGQGIPSPGGPFTAQMGAGEQQLLQQLMGFAGGQSPLMGAAQGQVMQTLGGQNLSPDSNPFLQQTIDAATRPLMQAFQETTLPQMRAQHTAGGQMVQPGGSSPFDMAHARAQSGLMDAMGDVTSKIAHDNFQMERQRQFQAVEQGLNLNRGQMDQMMQGLQASALPRLIEQHGMDQGLQVFNQQMQMFLQALQMAAGVSSPQTAVLPGVSGTSGALGELMQGAGALIPFIGGGN